MPTKTRLLCIILALAFVGRLGAAAKRLETPKSGALMMGTTLATPPKQGQPWKPPASKLPKNWASAVQEILKHGIADPRGCEYREVEFTCGSSTWSGTGLVTTHAWVIPRGPTEKEAAQRLAVTWDGLVYPLAKMGSAADLKRDVEAMLVPTTRGGKGPSRNTRRRPKRIRNARIAYWPHRWDHALPESSLVSYESLLPLKSCIMCILGDGELAEPLERMETRHRDGWGSQVSADDPYLLFARQWGWAHVRPGRGRPQARRRRHLDARCRDPCTTGASGGSGRCRERVSATSRPWPRQSQDALSQTSESRLATVGG